MFSSLMPCVTVHHLQCPAFPRPSPLAHSPSPRHPGQQLELSQISCLPGGIEVFQGIGYLQSFTYMCLEGYQVLSTLPKLIVS